MMLPPSRQNRDPEKDAVQDMLHSERKVALEKAEKALKEELVNLVTKNS